jgi:hypothetical protein
MPVPGLHVRRLDLQHTGLGCQPVTQLVQQIFPPLADFAMDRAHAARLSASARRSLSCGAKAPADNRLYRAVIVHNLKMSDCVAHLGWIEPSEWRNQNVLDCSIISTPLNKGLTSCPSDSN